MGRVLAVMLAVALAVLTASWPAVYGEKPVPATPYVPPLHFKRSLGLADDEAVMERLARAMDQSHLVSRSQGCGGSLSGSGALNSPGYPSEYPNDLQCVWTIKAPVGQHVKLTIDDMEIENQSFCAWDQLFIRVANEIVPAVLCGSGSVSGSFISGGNEMTVIFLSDESVAEKGFSATYSAISL
ncbi:membrane frizzled-related protein-like isoform X2 [Patiria miniata]|uniref:CUB domain-containing protein n=1 Tax=Patiria miniata TaxID=46514 RepID=A0A914B638_PATMI|nr:membrane frizzled-related protein-like isoform X2 [Patiria miniata]